ncbi:MAG TPA: ribbon-helix-helix protein, CopG family [Thermomicrobiales bacterium]|jgi:predicted transcriptional regulator
MKDVTISARIPEELSDQLSTLAQALRRNRSWVIEEALRGYIASETEFLEAVDEGLRAAESGDVVEHEAVNAIMAERRQRLLKALNR